MKIKVPLLLRTMTYLEVRKIIHDRICYKFFNMMQATPVVYANSAQP